MKFLFRTLAIALAVCYTAVASAQFGLAADKLAEVPVEQLPAQDNASLLAKEKALQEKGRPPRFAVPIPMKITPANNGIWTRENGEEVWRIRIVSPGAKTLNLGFSEYKLPAGASLFLASPAERQGPFTAMDNEDHNQFWTPMLEGDELVVELRVPVGRRGEVQLRLAFVNHDFADFRKSLSGSCNVDVVCGTEDGLGIVEKYRDIIRSVAVYSLNGNQTCTGFLVNSVNNDGTPFFMTAAHCGVSAANAPSLVAYWNYENSTCRTPNSPASGGIGNGVLTAFNSGSELLARNAASDVILTLLDDPIAPTANAFFAGWSAEAAAPVDTMIAIHHPNLEEKRISFSFQDPFRAAYTSRNNPLPDANHLTIPDWDIGTTEPGSSGSPVFDQFRRVRGQLHGGRAACGNDFEDSYGYFHSSWNDGETPATRLRDWLDPCGTGILTIDGLDQSDIPRQLIADTYCRSSCAGESSQFAFTVGSAFPQNTVLSIVGGAALNPVLSTTSATGGQAVTVTIPGDENLPPGRYEVIVRAVGGGFSDNTTFTTEFFDSRPAPPAITAPANGTEGVLLNPRFSWAPAFSATTYDVELSLTSNFSTILEQVTGVTNTSLVFSTTLEGNTSYFWRIRTINNCGVGDWRSATFTTADLSCANFIGQDLPLPITTVADVAYDVFIEVENSLEISSLEVTLDIRHTFVGDLSATLTSPSGTEVQLFNRVLNGGCPANDLYLLLSDAASNTADQYTANCANATAGTRLSYAPAEALAAFAGEDAEGVWTLTVTDNAAQDAGAIERADLFFCTSSGLADFSLSTTTTMLDVCETSDNTVVINLGADFDSEVALSVDVNEQQLGNYNVTYNPAGPSLTVEFSGWASLGVGTYSLVFTVTNPDNTTRTLLLPLTVSTTVAAANLVSPANEARLQDAAITFEWAAVAGADTYAFQYSQAADFASVAVQEIVTTTSVTLSDIPTQDPVYWRVIARNACGETISAVRQFSLFPVGLHDFGDGRKINIYPNPVRDLLTVDASGAWPGGISAVLFDATGRRMADYQMAGAGRNQWALGTVPAGVYYLRLSAAGEQRTERLVVVR